MTFHTVELDRAEHLMTDFIECSGHLLSDIKLISIHLEIIKSADIF